MFYSGYRGDGTYCKEPLNVELIVGIVVPLVLVISLGCFLIIFYFRRRESQRREENSIPLTQLKRLENIEIQEKLGSGHFGEVYRGVWMVRRR